MNVNELYLLTTWVEENVSDAGIQNLYSKFHKLLQQNTQPNQQKVPFEEEKEELFSGLRAIPIEQLTDSQTQVLEKIGILQNIGEVGVKNIENVLSGHAVDVATAEQKVASSMQSVKNGVSWAQQTKTQLSHILDAEIHPPLAENEILIRIRFAELASIANIQDLRNWSKIWWEIVRGVTMLHGKPPEAVKIVGASKGSILFDLIGYSAFARVLLSVVNKSLEAAERFQNLRIINQKIRAAKLETDDAERTFTEAMETERANRIEAITQGVLENIEAQAEIDGEVANGLKNSIEQLVAFVEKGGHIDFIMPPSPDPEDEETVVETEEIRELRQMTETVRLLETKVKLLENGDTEQQ